MFSLTSPSFIPTGESLYVNIFARNTAAVFVWDEEEEINVIKESKETCRSTYPVLHMEESRSSPSEKNSHWMPRMGELLANFAYLEYSNDNIPSSIAFAKASLSIQFFLSGLFDSLPFDFADSLDDLAAIFKTLQFTTLDHFLLTSDREALFNTIKETRGSPANFYIIGLAFLSLGKCLEFENEKHRSYLKQIYLLSSTFLEAANTKTANFLLTEMVCTALSRIEIKKNLSNIAVAHELLDKALALNPSPAMQRTVSQLKAYDYSRIENTAKKEEHEKRVNMLYCQKIA